MRRLRSSSARGCELGQLIIAASTTTGKILGARTEGAGGALTRQLDQLNQHTARIYATIDQLAATVEAALDVIRADANLQPDKVAAFWSNIALTGPTPDQAKDLQAILGGTDLKTYLALVTDPKPAASRPSVFDTVASMAAVTVRSVGAWLDDLLPLALAEQTPQSFTTIGGRIGLTSPVTQR